MSKLTSSQRVFAPTMALDKIVSQIKSLSGDESKLTQLADILAKEEGDLDRHNAHLVAALGALDPAQHSLGYLYLL